MSHIPHQICVTIDCISKAGIICSLAWIAIIPFSRRMRVYALKYIAILIICLLWGLYWMSGQHFIRVHASGGSIIILHLKPTLPNRFFVNFYRPIYSLWLGMEFQEQPFAWDVAFQDTDPTPKIKATTSTLTLYVGVDTNSPPGNHWVYLMDYFDSHDQAVCVSGFASDQPAPNNPLQIWVRNSQDPVPPKVFWQNPDGKLIPIPITQ